MTNKHLARTLHLLWSLARGGAVRLGAGSKKGSTQSGQLCVWTGRMRSLFLTGLLWRCFFVVGSGLAATAACGRHDVDGPVTKNSAVEPIRRAATGNLQI